MYFPADIVQKRTGENWKYNPSVDDIIKTETVPANMRPAVNGDPSIGYPGNNFTANPMKHWRKQRVPTFDAQDFTRSNTLENTFEIPGGTTVRGASSKDCTICEDQTEVPSVNITYRPKNNINTSKCFIPLHLRIIVTMLISVLLTRILLNVVFRSVIQKRKQEWLSVILVLLIPTVQNQNIIPLMHPTYRPDVELTNKIIFNMELPMFQNARI